MIISHKHKFIFLKTAKTGGTSVELALRTVCGPDDIITPIGDEDESLNTGLAPRNYKTAAKFLSGDWLYGVRNRLRRRSAPKYLYNHIPGWRVRARVGEDIWNSYFKFCFERNPWDREISLYFFRRGRDGNADTFAGHLKTLKQRQIRNWEIYSQAGAPAMDFMGRYENLEADLTLALQNCGIDRTVTLPQAKARFRTDRRPYREFYDDRSREMIANTYRREIEYFGYEF